MTCQLSLGGRQQRNRGAGPKDCCDLGTTHPLFFSCSARTMAPWFLLASVVPQANFQAGFVVMRTRRHYGRQTLDLHNLLMQQTTRTALIHT